jgi:hypothetical protein
MIKIRLYRVPPERAHVPSEDIDPIDLAGSESFPASDPPSWTGAKAGRPSEASAPGKPGPAGRAKPGLAIRRVIISMRGRIRRWRENG